MTLTGGGGNGDVSGEVSDIKTVTDTLAPSVTEATGTFSFDETSAAEQDAIELTITARVVIGSIWLDFVNVTQDVTIKVYHKVDGTNYRQFQENSWVDATDVAGVLITGFTAYRDVKVSLTCGGGGGGSVNVPYVVV
jgi:hypothetical protein